MPSHQQNIKILIVIYSTIFPGIFRTVTYYFAGCQQTIVRVDLDEIGALQLRAVFRQGVQILLNEVVTMEPGCRGFQKVGIMIKVAMVMSSMCSMVSCKAGEILHSSWGADFPPTTHLEDYTKQWPKNEPPDLISHQDSQKCRQQWNLW